MPSDEGQAPPRELQTGAGGGGSSSGENIELGVQLNNPYRVTNMDSAYAVLTAKGVSSPIPFSIKRTHYYVKFKPQNLYQLETLAADTALTLSMVPYDYTIAKAGNVYHDPSLPDSVPTYQYASVKAGYIFNDTIPYDILANLYIPEEDMSLRGINDVNEPYMSRLLDEAYRLTGNHADTAYIDPSTGQRRSKYYPSGNIKLFDTRLGSLYGMEGIEVHARRWFTTYKTKADFNGNFQMSSQFRDPCNYSAWFQNRRFSVREHFFGGVNWIEGPKQRTPWIHSINDGYDRFVGHVFRGAYRYHYKDISGLERPFVLALYRSLSYIAKDESNGSTSGECANSFPVIRIWRLDGNANAAEYSSDDIFSTTCHETGHYAHRKIMNASFIQFNQVTDQLVESWAVCIQWWITSLEYRNTRSVINYGTEMYDDFPIPRRPIHYAYQYWRPSNKNAEVYTNLYINILDNFNEIGVPFPGRPDGSVDDQVFGYNIDQLEQDIVKYAYGLTSLGQKLKLYRPTSVTDAQIDLLLSHY